MCGIFGIVAGDRARISRKDLTEGIRDLSLFSESRGKEASGLATMLSNHIYLLKSHVSPMAMVKKREYKDWLRTILGEQSMLGSPGIPVTFIGHSRLVTTGTQYDNRNNQPVAAGGMVGIHNGIIINHNELWATHSDLVRCCDVDTEIILSLLRKFFGENNSLLHAAQKTYGEIEGMASIAVLSNDTDILLLSTNNGSLYYCVDEKCGLLVFASEEFILKRFLQQHYIKKLLGSCPINHIPADNACLVNTKDLNIKRFRLKDEQYDSDATPRIGMPRIIQETVIQEKASIDPGFFQRKIGTDGFLDESAIRYLARIKESFPHRASWQDSLRRCTRCILPETMPFIAFDENGVCNYCRQYKKLQFYGYDKLQELVSRYKTNSDRPDCVVGLSGGRDSLYSLHYIKRVLKMNPVAYTYDWGMVTDLARRNISRICAKLGVEHILVSADITLKRKFIKKNVSAWLKKPELGMIPLFMAGDKQYFYYLRKVRKQFGAKLHFLGENMLERTDFKTGFAGVAPYNKDPHHAYTLPFWDKFKLLCYYGRNYLANPGYINISLFDTLSAYASIYLTPREYINLYNYIPWIEEKVISTLRDEYDFELATDSKTTWRIGDRTSAFYNYVYYNVAGFTENETFRSNQIREGLIAREDALRRVKEENKPRYEAIYWYLKIIGLDQDIYEVFRIINGISKIKA